MRGPSEPIESGVTTSADLKRRLVRGAVVVTGVLVFQAAGDLAVGRDPAFLATRIAFWAIELPLLLGMVTAVLRWSAVRKLSATQSVLAALIVATLLGLALGPVYVGLARWVGLHARVAENLGRASLYGALHAQLYAGLWALAFAYPAAVERERIRALEAQHLRTEAELARLRVHLEPHFLLNTLNAIAGLVTSEPREARRLLVCLGDLLRDAVREASDRQRLDDQVAWLRRYADILEARHRGVLRFRWEIAPETTGILLPRLLLQPLVENAVKHGALRRPGGGGEVLVRAEPVGGTIVCTIQDNGPGLTGQEERFGLHAVRRRLALEVPGSSLRLESSQDGTRSIIEVPASGVQEAA